ncbi:MAG: zinc ribbon domain-containing protein [Actinomycetota bacterium]
MQPSHETLLELLELQKIDSIIDRLEYRRRNLPEQAEVDSLGARMDSLQSALGDQQALADDCALRQRKLDGEVESLSLKIAAEEARLFEGKVASPRELSALQAEIESLKRRRSVIEDSDLEVMEEREAVDARLQALKTDEQALNATIAEAVAKRDAALREIEGELATATSERGAWLGKFDGELLSTYNDLRATKGGVGIALLESGTCQGCHMKLPAQEVAQLKRSDSMAKCVECGRILIIA